MKFLFGLGFCLIVVCKMAGQQDDSLRKPIQVKEIKYKLQHANISISDEGYDVPAIDLEEVLVLTPFRYKSRDERRQYLILRRKTRKVWPYAVMASNRLNTLYERLDKIETKHGKRKYTQMVQDYIEEEFTEELKKLTKTEGQILVKLMYRQTGKTTFQTVKELKSGWRAFWYNTTASFFNISLKKMFDPLQEKEDYYIEYILRRSFQEGLLEPQAAAIPINFIECMHKWE